MDLTYELPPKIKALQASWLATFQTSAVISALFSGVASQPLGFNEDLHLFVRFNRWVLYS